MTVEILRLSGLTLAEATEAAGVMIDVRTGPRDLRNLLVVDDTALLGEHEAVYASLDNAARVEEMLCVVVGSRSGSGRKLALPGNLAGTQGSPVLWVSDPAGIDCRVAVAAVAIGHVPGKVSGLDLLIEILSAEEMFKCVHKTVIEVPRRVASPGMRLAGQEDEAATFATALVLAIRALCGAGLGAQGPFRELLPSDSRGASLAEGGQLARYRDEVVAASDGAGKRAGRGGRLRQGQADSRARLVEAGAALADLRDLIAQLLANANAVGELTDNQRRLIASAGVQFPAGPSDPTPAGVSGPAVDQPLIYQAVAKAVHGGDALALVSKRLTLTERELKHNGSGSYLPEVAQRCPQVLIDRLDNPAGRPSRRGPDEDLAGAAAAARALEDLILTVATREWSPAGPSRSEVGRVRAALDGAARALNEYAGTTGAVGGPSGTRSARLADLLTPVLRDLVVHVVGAETSRPSGTAIEALEAARNRANALVTDWVGRVQADGISAETPFPGSGRPRISLYASPDDVTEIREALLCPPVAEMWQLCGPDDLKNVLNLTVRPAAVGFASRLSKDALATAASRDRPLVWTSSGANAGLLRLISLRPEYVVTGHVAQVESS